MKAIFNTKKINGLCFGGKKYGGYTSIPQIDFFVGVEIVKKVTTSLNSEQTSGYAVSYTIDSTKQFNLYTQEDWNSPLNYLPEYSFVLFWGSETAISTLTLVYDGDGLFHIEGTIPEVTYDTSKDSISGVGGGKIYIIDKNGNVFLSSTSGIITTSKSTSSTTISYISATTTTELNEKQFETHTLTDIELPYSLIDKTAGSIYKDDGVVYNVLYPAGTALSSFTLSVYIQYKDIIL